jgi:hypothetical protein
MLQEIAQFSQNPKLGPEFGGAIGLMFTLANSIAVSMYLIGFVEALLDMLEQYVDGFTSILHAGTVLFLPWLCPGSTVVDYSTRDPKIEGLNPTTGTRREKIVKKVYSLIYNPFQL